MQSEQIIKPYRIAKLYELSRHHPKLELQKKQPTPQLLYEVKQMKVFEMPTLRLPKINKPSKSQHITPMKFRNERNSLIYQNISYRKFDCYDFLVVNSSSNIQSVI